jgi:hypothetical protein
LTKYFDKISIADEPSDVIHESLHLLKSEKNKKTKITRFKITGFLIIVFILMIIMFSYTSNISTKYPKFKNC